VENKPIPKAPDSVTITPLGGTDPFPIQPPFSVNGTGTPDGAVVAGVLSPKGGGANIQSDNTFKISGQAWGPINFSNAPLGEYFLTVQEQAPNEGSGTINVMVIGS
jgi:hypothetical protein